MTSQWQEAVREEEGAREPQMRTPRRHHPQCGCGGAGGVTLVSDVPKVARQVLAAWGWLPAAMWSARIASWRIGVFPFPYLEFECQLGVLERALAGIRCSVQHPDLG